jgi:hypothetical protein
VEIGYADLDFSAAALSAGRLPVHLGKTLRGALGLALRNAVCQNKEAACDACVLRERCAYSVIFEGVPPAGRRIMRKYPRIPQPFVLVVPAETPVELAEGQSINFGIRLFGPAVELYPYAIHAATQFLGRGLGACRLPFALTEVRDGSRCIFRAGQSTITAPARNWLKVSPDPCPPVSVIRIALVTPLQLQVNSRIADKPSLEALLRAAVRRCHVLGEFYGEGGELPVPRDLLDDARRSPVVHSDLTVQKVRRVSGRQKQLVVMRGVTGRTTFAWPEDRPGPQQWLQAASILHLGKATTFGFGRIEYEVERP